MKISINALCTIAMLTVSSASANDSVIDSEYLASVVNGIKSRAGLNSGTAVAVVKGDKVIYEGYFGYKDIAAKSKVDENTIFYLASATKPLTALNFLLDSQKYPELKKTTIAQMFPKFAVSDRKTVTASHLLTHTASINNLPLVLATAYSGEHSHKSLQEIVTTLSTASSEPVGEFKYTNVGYNIYSIYSDKRFDSTWQQKLAWQVFTPAGMHNTTAVRSLISDERNIARSYSLPEENNNEALYLEKRDNTLHAAGGVYSTASDMARFLVAQLNDGVLNGEQVYPAAVVEDSHTKQVAADTSYGDFERDGYAWGWYTGEYKQQPLLHHFGGFAGVHSHLSFMPEQKLGLVVLNGEDFLSARLTGLIADYVYGAMLGEKDIKQNISLKAEKLGAKLDSLDEMIAHEKEKIASRKWLLSLPATHYVGQYKHPLLGTISVSLNDQQRFNVQWGVMHSNSTGMNEKDQIRVELDPTSGSVIEFNVEENVIGLKYAGERFIKV